MRNLSLDFVPIETRDINTLEITKIHVRGLVTNEYIRPGERIFFIPLHLTLDPELAYEDPDLGQMLIEAGVDEHTALILWILW